MIVSIPSINVDGSGEVYRRQKFFEIFKGSNGDIFLVQETNKFHQMSFTFSFHSSFAGGCTLSFSLLIVDISFLYLGNLP